MLFSKGLNHNEQGFVKKEELNKLLQGHNYPNLVRFSYEDKCFTEVNDDLIELYCLSLARDIPFANYSYSVHIIDFQIKTPQLSFFLNKEYLTDLPVDYLTDRQALISNQNGNLMITRQTNNIRAILTGRDLCSYIKDHSIYETITDVIKVIYFTQPIAISLNEVLERILKSAFKATKLCYQLKWSQFKLRPEALALEVDRAIRTNHNRYNLPETLLNHSILKLIFLKQGNYLLSQTNSEGAEISPSSPDLNVFVLRNIISKLEKLFDLNLLITNSSTVRNELDKLVENLMLAGLYAGTNYREDSL